MNLILFLKHKKVIKVLILGKYHRGRLVDGMWVFGGVERDTHSGDCFLIPVPDRSAPTLLALINEWILPGTIICSDCWVAYNNIMY